MVEKALRYLSLSAKAGKIIVGTEDCNKAVQKGVEGLVIIAVDAAQNARKSAELMARSERIRILRSEFTKWQISAAVGRNNAVAVVMITDKGLADAIISAAAVAMEQEEQI